MVQLQFENSGVIETDEAVGKSHPADIDAVDDGEDDAEEGNISDNIGVERDGDDRESNFHEDNAQNKNTQEKPNEKISVLLINFIFQVSLKWKIASKNRDAVEVDRKGGKIRVALVAGALDNFDGLTIARIKFLSQPRSWNKSSKDLEGNPDP